MKISQKLQLIQSLSGLSQEKIAKELGVSFATINSWINSRSVPRAERQKAIDRLYFKYSGQKSVDVPVSSAKQDIIITKSKAYKNIIKTIISRPDIYKQLILSFTYNTNVIEGSTLSENETADILFENASLPNKDLVEHLEAKNHQSALEFLFSVINEKFKITEPFILRLHSILMNSIRHDAGMYRRHGVRIVGANVPTANYLKIPELMEKLIIDINKPPKNAIKQVAEIHSRFEKIHPFSDGNGRIGRLIMAAMLLRYNIAPAIIQQKQKRNYYKYLNHSQQQDDFMNLEEFIADAILEGFKIIE